MWAWMVMAGAKGRGDVEAAVQHQGERGEKPDVRLLPLAAEGEGEGDASD